MSGTLATSNLMYSRKMKRSDAIYQKRVDQQYVGKLWGIDKNTCVLQNIHIFFFCEIKKIERAPLCVC